MMRLHGLMYYRSKSDTWTDAWRNADYTARNMVKAVKCLDFNGSSKLKAGSQEYTISNDKNGRAIALNLAARLFVLKLKEAGYKSASIVPIPSSSHTNPQGMFTGRRIADAMQAIDPAFVSNPILFFNEPMEKSSAGGGTRNAYVIQQNLRMVGCGTPANVVLLDDVYTTGGHMKAAARFLSQAGCEVEDALVVGRTVWDKREKMFSVEIEDVLTKGISNL